jgi:hypothetical protein
LPLCLHCRRPRLALGLELLQPDYHSAAATAQFHGGAPSPRFVALHFARFGVPVPAHCCSAPGADPRSQALSLCAAGLLLEFDLHPDYSP